MRYTLSCPWSNTKFPVDRKCDGFRLRVFFLFNFFHKDFQKKETFFFFLLTDQIPKEIKFELKNSQKNMLFKFFVCENIYRNRLLHYNAGFVSFLVHSFDYRSLELYQQWNHYTGKGTKSLVNPDGKVNVPEFKKASAQYQKKASKGLKGKSSYK